MLRNIAGLAGLCILICGFCMKKWASVPLANRPTLTADEPEWGASAIESSV
ncbi:hypothetical protein ACWDFL_39045 [Streptomyces bungoensis]